MGKKAGLATMKQVIAHKKKWRKTRTLSRSRIMSGDALANVLSSSWFQHCGSGTARSSYGIPAREALTVGICRLGNADSRHVMSAAELVACRSYSGSSSRVGHRDKCDRPSVLISVRVKK